MKKIKGEKGITLIALVITIIVLLILAGVSISMLTGENGIITQANYAAFATKIGEYKDKVTVHVAGEQLNSGEDVGNTNVNVLDPEEMKGILGEDREPGDENKYVIQDNELRYNPDTVTDQEEKWLIRLGILAMTVSTFLITFMASGSVYQTIQANKITFPEIDPTSTEGNFAGWYYEEEGITQATEETEITSDVTLYAKFGDYIATFMVDGSVYDTIEGNSLTFPKTNPTKNGVSFLGWYNEDGDKVSEGTELTGNITLYAGWSFILGGSSNNWYNNYISSGESEPALQDPDSDGIWYFQFSEFINICKIAVMPLNGSSYRLLSTSGDVSKYNPSLDENGNLLVDGLPNLEVNGSFTIEVTYDNGQKEIYNYRFNGNIYCLAEGTEITLADMSKKNIEDITYEDELLVWDFDNGCFAKAKPLWIKKVQEAEEYNLIKFDDGTELKTVIDHRIFNIEKQKFTYTMDEEETPIGTSVFKEDGSVAKIVERSVVKEKVNYYNVITDYHMNLFANGLLTSLRLNNLYKIENMKFVKDNRELTPREEFEGIPDKYFYGLRLAEQPKEINRGNDVRHTKTLQEYVERLLPLEK